MNKQLQDAMEKITRKLIDDGRLIEAGWIGLKMMSLSPDAPAEQVDDMRSAFFAGAQHVFSSIMTMLDPGTEATGADERRMSAIDAELKKFIRDYESKHLTTKGSA